MNIISFRLKSEMKFQQVELDSPFVSIGELRRLICEHLGLDQTRETVELFDYAPTGDEFVDDSKLISRGQKVKVARIPVSRRNPSGNATDRAGVPAQPDVQPSNHDSSAAPAADEFGGDVFDEEEQIRRLADDQQKEWAKAKRSLPHWHQQRDAAAQRPGGPADGPSDPSEEGAYRKKGTLPARGIPSVFLSRVNEPPPSNGEAKPSTIKLQDGTMATLATGELQQREERAELEKQKADAAANAKPTLAPLPSLAFDDAFSLLPGPTDLMAAVRSQLPAASQAPSVPALEAAAPAKPTPPPSPGLELALPGAAAGLGAPSSSSLALVAQPRPAALSTAAQQMLQVCRSFLPRATDEQLARAFAIEEPMSYDEWEDFAESIAPPRRGSPAGGGAPRRRSVTPDARGWRRRDESPERRRDGSRERPRARRELRRGEDLRVRLARRGGPGREADDDEELAPRKRAREPSRERHRSRSHDRGSDAVARALDDGEPAYRERRQDRRPSLSRGGGYDSADEPERKRAGVAVGMDDRSPGGSAGDRPHARPGRGRASGERDVLDRDDGGREDLGHARRSTPLDTARSPSRDGREPSASPERAARSPSAERPRDKDRAKREKRERREKRGKDERREKRSKKDKRERKDRRRERDGDAAVKGSPLPEPGRGRANFEGSPLAVARDEPLNHDDDIPPHIAIEQAIKKKRSRNVFVHAMAGIANGS